MQAQTISSRQIFFGLFQYAIQGLINWGAVLTYSASIEMERWAKMG